MLNQPTLKKLVDLRLGGMVEAYERQRHDPSITELSFEERLAMIVESEWLHQKNRSLKRRVAYAHFRQQASLEDINYRLSRGIKRDLINQLANCEWIRFARNCLITGPTGIGKSYLACALGHQACREGYRVLYYHAPRLFRDLLAANVDGTLSKFIRKISRLDLLIIDDWGLATVQPNQYRDFLELIDERHQHGSVLISSQYPRNTWHELIGDSTVADAIIDRLISNAAVIELDGPSVRQTINATSKEDTNSKKA